MNAMCECSLTCAYDIDRLGIMELFQIYLVNTTCKIKFLYFVILSFHVLYFLHKVPKNLVEEKFILEQFILSFSLVNVQM